MSKTLITLKQHLSTLRKIYVIPTEAARVTTRSEVRRIVQTVSFTSNIPQLHYEDLESAALLGSK